LNEEILFVYLLLKDAFTQQEAQKNAADRGFLPSEREVRGAIIPDRRPSEREVRGAIIPALAGSEVQNCLKTTREQNRRL